MFKLYKFKSNECFIFFNPLRWQSLPQATPNWACRKQKLCQSSSHSVFLVVPYPWDCRGSLGHCNLTLSLIQAELYINSKNSHIQTPFQLLCELIFHKMRIGEKQCIAHINKQAHANGLTSLHWWFSQCCQQCTVKFPKSMAMRKIL